MPEPADHDLRRRERPLQLLHRNAGSGQPLNTLRVTSGTLRGRRVPVPPRETRPTSERARMAFFNIAGPRIDGAQFLDLFAGSGIFSFEAISRGAAAATAIEQDRQSAATIARLAREWNAPVTATAADV